MGESMSKDIVFFKKENKKTLSKLMIGFLNY